VKVTWRTRNVVIIAVLAVVVVSGILKDWLLAVWKSLNSWEQDAIASGVAGLFVGVLSSMVASYLIGKEKREVWQKEVGLLKEQLSDLKEQLSAMNLEHQQLLKRLVPAIGGEFTNSLFSFHPMASERIAAILSKESDRLYTRHHKRVIVTTAKDEYTITGLQQFESVLVWSLEFHITWLWKNDSRITKRPLEDFQLVAVANSEALDDFLTKRESEALKQSKRKELEELLAANVAKLTVENPLDLAKRIPDDRVNEIFMFDKVYVTEEGRETTLIDRADLVPAKKPMGVYEAWALPSQLNVSLPVHATLQVEYFGRMFLLATVEDPDDRVYKGLMTYRPSDVISDQYEMRLSYPANLTVDGKRVRLEVDKEKSGSQSVYGPLENHPQDMADGKGDRLAEMRVSGPLTDLHQLSLIWRGHLQA
jgi:hypothetical protein